MRAVRLSLAVLSLAAGCGRIDFDPQRAPQADAGFIPQRSFALGFSHTCLRATTGALMCWGDGSRGRLGYGNTTNIGDDEPASAAGDVPLGAAATELDAGADHTCAVVAAGGVRCWGGNQFGKLGYANIATIGDDEPASAGGDVSVGGVVVEVAVAGSHSCARLDTGAVRCWGGGANGRLGRGDTVTIGDDELPSSAPVVSIGELAVEIQARGSHTCARTVSGGVRCWGAGANGQLGYASVADVGDDETPATVGDVMLGAAAQELAVGAGHTCARTTGAVRCWGNGADGTLGYANTTTIGDDETPATAGDVPLGGEIVQLSAGASHTCALLDTGGVRCWGLGSAGQLGYGNTDSIGDDETPASIGDVPLGGRAVGIAAGGNRSCALLDTGAVRCWGDGSLGALGYGNTQSIGDDETPADVGDVLLN